MAGAYDIAVVAGIESMSRVPMGSARMGVDPFGPSVAERYAPGLVPQGVSAELMAAKWKLSRAELDDYAVRSQTLAASAALDGEFAREIVPIDNGSAIVIADETIRSGTTPEALAKLKPSFASEEWSARFPQIDWKVTAGNSSQLADGATAALVMNEQLAQRLGLTPLARFHSFAVCGDDPILMLAGIIPATRRVLQRSGVALGDIGHIEINEAFASVPLAWMREFRVDPDIVNPLGGAIALGHPLGASGTRLLATMTQAMARGGARYGLQLMCELGGMANATLIENLVTHNGKAHRAAI